MAELKDKIRHFSTFFKNFEKDARWARTSPRFFLQKPASRLEPEFSSSTPHPQ